METKIKINNIQLFGYHGTSENEKINGQLFEIDIEVSIDNETIISDNLSQTIDYTLLYDVVTTIFSKRRYNLIEYLAKEIADEMSIKYRVNSCKIVIRKPNAPIKGDFDSVEVELISNG